MITEQDLQAAIAECNGKRNPDSNTCVKLAAFYIIKDHMFPDEPETERGYSYSAPTGNIVNHPGDSEFLNAIQGMYMDDVIEIMDEAMEALQVLNPPFYASIIRKLNGM